MTKSVLARAEFHSDTNYQNFLEFLDYRVASNMYEKNDATRVIEFFTTDFHPSMVGAIKDNGGDWYPLF